MGYSQLRLCNHGAAYEAVPNPRLALDLVRVGQRLKAAGIEAIDARVMLIAQFDREVTIARDGRVLIKSRDAAEASRLFDRVRPMLGVPPDSEAGRPGPRQELSSDAP